MSSMPRPTGIFSIRRRWMYSVLVQSIIMGYQGFFGVSDIAMVRLGRCKKKPTMEFFLKEIEFVTWMQRHRTVSRLRIFFIETRRICSVQKVYIGYQARSFPIRQFVSHGGGCLCMTHTTAATDVRDFQTGDALLFEMVVRQFDSPVCVRLCPTPQLDEPERYKPRKRYFCDGESIQDAQAPPHRQRGKSGSAKTEGTSET